MTATWTAPHTWVADELVDENDLNTHLRDNLDWLKDRPMGGSILNLGADITYNSATFGAIDATNFKSAALVVPSAGADVALFIAMTIAHNTAANQTHLDWFNSQTAARVGGDDGIIAITTPVANYKMNFSFVYILEGLTGGLTYTFTPYIKTTANTATIFAGAGTANGDLHPQCFARLI